MVRHTGAASSLVVNDNFSMAPVPTEMRNQSNENRRYKNLSKKSKRNYSECIGVANATKRTETNQNNTQHKKVADGIRTLSEFVTKRETSSPYRPYRDSKLWKVQLNILKNSVNSCMIIKYYHSVKRKTFNRPRMLVQRWKKTTF